MEPEYDVVDDQEEVLRVHILPARPIIEDQAYADRDCLRPYPNQSVSSVSTDPAQMSNPRGPSSSHRSCYKQRTEAGATKDQIR
nr:uncharacterized protein LOC107379234 isoform X3 [Nothobranchius furzeri]